MKTLARSFQDYKARSVQSYPKHPLLDYPAESVFFRVIADTTG